MATYKVGQAPWETENNQPQSFKVGQAPWEQEEVKPKATGLQSFVQAVSKPFLKVASSVQALGAAGDQQKFNKIQNEGIDYGYFGNAKPVGAGFDITQGLTEGNIAALKDAVGTGAEIGGTIAGGGGSVGAVKTGLKGLIKQGAKEGLKVGASTGGAMGFGQALQDAESKPMDVAYNTIFGATLGGVTGGVLGAATPAAVKGVQKAKSYTKIPELEAKLSEGYRKIFNPTARQVKADTRFGNDSFKFLSQEMQDLPIKVNSAGRIEADEAIEMAKMKYSAEAAAYKPIIRNSGKYIDVDNTIAQMKAAAKKEFDGSDLVKAKQQIENEVEAYLRNNPQDINVTESGKRFVTLSRADDIKSYSWSRGKGWGTPEAEVWNDTNNIIGHAFKDAIEKELPSAPIKAMNKRLGQWKNAIDMLEKRNGQVSGSGGKLSKYLTKSVGTTIGASLGGNEGGVGGGLTGAGTGFLTATALASAMANPNIRLYVVRQLLNKLNKAGRKDMIQEAEQILQEQASRYLLPAAGKSSYVEKPIVLPTSVRETNLGLDEVRNAKIGQSQPKPLAMTEPTAAPTTQTNINSKNPIEPNTTTNKASKSMEEINIEESRKSIAQYKKMIADPKSDSQTIAFAKRGLEGEKEYLKNKGLNEVAGGVAGIEIKKDENGKIVVSFNPEKAVAGVVGIASFKKIPAKLKQDALDTMWLFKKFKASDFVKDGKLNIEAFSTVEDLFDKAKKGTITAEDIKSAQEVHFMLKGNKK